jgi:hypothetical protein
MLNGIALILTKLVFLLCEYLNFTFRILRFTIISAPPERGLATKQMSGKKKLKFRISVGLGCNADGSEKLKMIFIGKFKKPRCFKKDSPEKRGFYYRNNKKAWMTTVIFEEYVSVSRPVSTILLTIGTDLSRALTSRCAMKTVTFVCLLIIFQHTTLPMNHKTSTLNLLHQI